MDTPLAPGWYNDPQSPDHVRWWDGQRWTEHQNPKTGPVAQAQAALPGGATRQRAATRTSAKARTRWLMPAAIGVAAFVLGVVVGVAGGGGAPTASEVRKSTEYIALADKLKVSEEQLTTTKGQLSSAKDALQEAGEREVALAERSNELSEREAAIAAKDTPSPSPSAAGVSGIPRPSTEQAAELVAALAKIDPTMAEKPDKTVSRARSQCESILATERGEGGSQSLVQLVHERFIGGNSPYTDAQAQAILDAIKVGGWCK